MELHPLCTLFPRMVGAEFQSLVKDIKANGLHEPIVTHDGMILDGGNRYRACLEAGAEPMFKPFEGTSVVAFVLSANLHRRHMTPGQQAAIVASCQDWAKAQSVGKPRNVAGLATAAERAVASGASQRTQETADAVAKADPKLSGRVARGEISLPKAAILAGVSKAPEAKVDAQAEIREAQKAEASAHKQLQTYIGICEADEPLKQAMAEIQKLRALNQILEDRIAGLMREKAEAVSMLKGYQRREKQEKKA